MLKHAKEQILHYLSRKAAGFWIWLACALMLACVALSLLTKILLDNDALARKAFETGQRAIIHIASGEIDGNTRHTKLAEKKVEEENASNSKEGLAPAPLAAITESSDKGLLPIIGKDGTLAWKYYARPYASKENRPMVAIILTNLGLSKPLTQEALKLPHNVTLSFSPYASDAKKWARNAREEGFESSVDLPLHPENFPISDPGAYGLLENLTISDSSARLHWILSRITGFVGVLGSVNEKLTANPAAILPTLTELSGRGVLFIYQKTSKNVGLIQIAKEKSIFLLGADSVIDQEITVASIDRQLSNLVTLAKANGSAIGIAHSYPPTLETLTQWAETLLDQGVDLVPISAIAHKIYP